METNEILKEVEIINNINNEQSKNEIDVDKNNNINKFNNFEDNDKESKENLDNKKNNNKNFPTITKNDQKVPLYYDFLFKISLLGDSGTGKTSLLLRLTDNIFNANTCSTIGVDFKILSLKYLDKLAKIQIWDTCGSERFKSLTTSFIKTCNVFVILFDLTNKKSFINTVYWLDLILDNTSPKIIYLIGNKSDLVKDLEIVEKIDSEEINKLCLKYNMKYYESSAKDNTNIEEMFQELMIDLFNDALNEIKNDNNVKINKGEKIYITENNDFRNNNENSSKSSKKNKSCISCKKE